MVLYDLKDVKNMTRSDLLFAMQIINERHSKEEIPNDVYNLIEAMYNKLEGINSIFCDMEKSVAEFNRLNKDKDSFNVPMMKGIDKIADLLRKAFES